MNKELGHARMLGFQLILEAFLRIKGKGSIKELTGNENFKFGEITNEELALLHFYLIDEFETLGLDLNAEIEKSGENVVPGKLSKYELDILIRKADQVMLIVDTVRQLVESNDQEIDNLANNNSEE